jgi:hypothetical protein
MGHIGSMVYLACARNIFAKEKDVDLVGCLMLK